MNSPDRRRSGVSSLDRRSRCLLLLVWVGFLLRGFFYVSLFPLWEGYDEWAHFAYVQHLVTGGDLPLSTKTPVSREVEESLRLVPLPWSERELSAPYRTHDAYWKLPAEERELRQQRLRSMPAEWAYEPATGKFFVYEAQQPPLYYWLLSWPLKAAGKASLPSRVMVLRWLSVLLASLVIPLGFLIARRVFHREGPAFGVAAMVAAMPELMVDIGRVGNDSAAIVLFTLLLYLSLKLVEGSESAGQALLLGAVLGLGLLTKAYLLTAVPALALIFALRFWALPGERNKILSSAVVAAATALLISGWWYWRNHLLIGSWVWQASEAAARNVPLLELLRRVPRVDWSNALDTIFFSHIWLGDWSFLQLRSWMYHFFRAVAGLVFLGLLILFWRFARGRRAQTDSPLRVGHLLVLIAFYGFFWLGMTYHALLMFVIHGVSASNGWYLYSVVVAEVILATAGLFALFPPRWHRWILPAGTGCFVLLELYATHFLLIPYYSGLITHRANGALASFRVHQLADVGLQAVLLPLQANKPSWLTTPLLVALWFLFLAATLGLVVLSVWANRRKNPGQMEAQAPR